MCRTGGDAGAVQPFCRRFHVPEVRRSGGSLARTGSTRYVAHFPLVPL